MAVKFDHLGVVVNDINEAARLYGEMLGLKPWDQGIVEDAPS